MKLVREPAPAIRQAVLALQESFCRLDPQEAAGRSPAHHAAVLTMARHRMTGNVAQTLASLPVTEAASFRQTVDCSLLLKGYDVAEGLATPLDSTLDLAELIDLWEETQTGLARWGREFDHENIEMVMATALHRSHNARTFCLDRRGPHIVLFQDRLLTLLNELAALGVWNLPRDETCSRLVSGRRQFAETIPRAGRVQRAEFLEMAQNFVRRHALHRWDAPGVRLTGIDDPRGDLAFDLYQGMKFFLMGHEMAHILLKHDTCSGAALALHEGFAEPSVPLHEVHRAHSEELQADLIGLHIGMLSAAANALALPTYFQSVLLFFAGVDWIERARRCAVDDSAGRVVSQPGQLVVSDTHPPLAARRAQIRRAVAAVGEGKPAYAPDFIDRLDRSVRALLRSDLRSTVRGPWMARRPLTQA